MLHKSSIHRQDFKLSGKSSVWIFLRIWPSFSASRAVATYLSLLFDPPDLCSHASTTIVSGSQHPPSEPRLACHPSTTAREYQIVCRTSSLTGHPEFRIDEQPVSPPIFGEFRPRPATLVDRDQFSRRDRFGGGTLLAREPNADNGFHHRGCQLAHTLHQ